MEKGMQTYPEEIMEEVVSRVRAGESQRALEKSTESANGQFSAGWKSPSHQGDETTNPQGHWQNINTRSWCKQGVRYWKRKEYEVIEILGVKYPVNFLCKIMAVNRSGYYKWTSRQGKPNQYEMDRRMLTRLLAEEHEKHLSHGYHMLAEDIFHATGWVVSHNLAHKYCKRAGIHSKAQRQENIAINLRAKKVLSFLMKFEGSGIPTTQCKSLYQTWRYLKARTCTGNGLFWYIHSTMRFLLTKL